MSSNPQEMTPQELVLAAKEKYEMTWAEMGQMMQRSEKMMRKVAQGQSSGESYRAALIELYTQGAVGKPTPRRRSKSGKIVAVRAKKGKMRTPEEVVRPGAWEDRPKRGRFAVAETQLLADGGRLHSIEMPKTQGSQGRKKGLKTIKDRLLRISRGQAHKDKRVKFRIAIDTGEGKARVMDVGSKNGYMVSDILSDVRILHNGDLDAWIRSQAGQRYLDTDVANSPVVRIETIEWDGARSKEERQAQDQAGTRRRGRTRFGGRR